MKVAIAALILIIIALLVKYFLNLRSKKHVGKSVDKSILSEEIQSLLKNEKSILYFFTPVCSVCKSQTLIIDKLKNDIDFVGKIDLMKYTDAAKEFGILGTPTIALMSGNQISEILVGLQKYNFLKQKFELL